MKQRSTIARLMGLLVALVLLAAACADEPMEEVDEAADADDAADADADEDEAEDVAGADEIDPEEAAASEGDLFMISYGGELQEPHRQFLADPFEERHEDVTVTLVPSEDADFVAQIQAARGDSPYDVVPLGEPRLPPAIEEGWITELDENDVPNLPDTYPQFQEACGAYGAPATYSLIGLAYDAERIEQPPEHWEDLWNEEYQDQVGMVSSASNLGFGFLLLTAMLNDGDEANIDVIWEALDDLAPFTVASSPRDLAQLFERGEIGVAPIWNNDAATLAEAGLDVEFALPEPGGVAIVSCMTVVQDTGNPELARELVNDVLSVEYQEQAAQLPWAFGPTNVNVEPPEESLDYIPADAEEVEALIQFDWETAAEGRDGVTEEFNQRYAR